MSKYVTYTMYNKNTNEWVKEKHKDLVFLFFLEKSITASIQSVRERLCLIFIGFRKTLHLSNREKPSTFQPLAPNCVLLSVSSSTSPPIHQQLLMAKKIMWHLSKHQPLVKNIHKYTLRWSSLHKLQLGPDGFKIPTPSKPWEWVMKAEAFTGAAWGVNADHYATENKTFITAAVFSSTVHFAKKTKQNKNAMAPFSQNTLTEFRISFSAFQPRGVLMKIHHILSSFGASSVGFQMFKTN